MIDAYKADHDAQYGDNVTMVCSNLTPRKSRIGIDSITFFGLQYYAIEYLISRWNRTFFHKEKKAAVNTYKRIIDHVVGADRVSMSRIERLHDIGHLPISIWALPEGSVVPIGVPPMIHFNEPNGPEKWITNFIETSMSSALWHPCTTSAVAREIVNVFRSYAAKTSDEEGMAEYQAHDFSYRGHASNESAIVSGAANLIWGYASDCVPAIPFLEEYYGADIDKENILKSCAATEHSVMCTGSKERELDTFVRILDLYPKDIVSVVSDTWDYWKVLTEYLPLLKDRIMSRNGKFVIRPDSSKKTPYEIIVGDSEAPVGSPEHRGSIQILWDTFGGKVNSKGYQQLDSHVGLCYGDSITLPLVDKINRGLMLRRFASTNWVAGIGSYTYQYLTRDSMGIAIKATACVVDGELTEIFKSPATDSGEKKSAKGLIAVYKDPVTGKFFARDRSTWDDVRNCAFEPVFERGKLIRRQTFAQIREVASAYLPQLIKI